MSPWRWTPERSHGIWRHGVAGLRPFVAAMPALTVVLLFAQLYVASRCLTVAEGTFFDLPGTAPTDVVPADEFGDLPVALMRADARGTFVFFDGTRYDMDKEASVRRLGEQLRVGFETSKRKSLLVLADRRVAGGELMRMAALAKENGVERILFASRRTGTDE